MRLDLTAHLANGILNLALSRAKGMLDRNRDVLVLGCIAMRFGDENVFMHRHRNTNIDLEQIALPMPRLRRDNRYVAAREWNFSSCLACFSTSDRMASDGSEFSKVISSGTCIWCPFTSNYIAFGEASLRTRRWAGATPTIS